MLSLNCKHVQNNSKMDNGIYLKIAGYVDLDMLYIITI
jgi:hypothetical protein